MRRSIWLVVPIALACSKPSSDSPPSGGSEAAIAEVLSGLRGSIALTGAPPVRYTLAERMERYKVPGVSIAVYDSGRLVWARGFGVKEAGTTDSVTPTTLFQAASISKPVAATGMLQLVEEGKLALDTAVNRYLKSWQIPENRFTQRSPVTLRRLVSHSAGLTVHGFPGYASTDSVPTVPQILDGIKPANTAPVRVDTFPGEIWRYSGGGTTVMQLVVMDVTGEPFPAVMKRLVLDPIGMRNSTYEQPLPDALRSQAAAGHKEDGTLVPGRWHTYPEMAAAGLWTTPTDLLTWAHEIAEAKAGRSTKVLDQATATEMLTPQKPPMGLGPSLEGSGRAFNFSHGGANNGFRSHVIYFPETGQGAAVMTNGDNGGSLAQEVLYAIAATYQWPEYGPREITEVSLDSAQMARLVGEYGATTPFPVSAKVVRAGSRLQLEVSIAPTMELVFTDSSTAVPSEGGPTIKFVQGRSGVAERLEVAGFKLERKKGS